MNCPKCNQEWHCGCKSCKENFPDLKPKMIFEENDYITCPTCGLSEHHDWWLDLQLKQDRVNVGNYELSTF